MSQFFASGGQSIGVSASASVLPMNIQDWFPLGWTGWISLLSKGTSRVFIPRSKASILLCSAFFIVQLYCPWSSPGQNTGVVAFPLSRGFFPTQGAKSRLPALQVDSLPAESQGKPKNTAMDSLSLLQWIFLTQESKWGLLNCRLILYQLSYQGSPTRTYFIAWGALLSILQ